MHLNELLTKKVIEVQLKDLRNDERGYALKHNGLWNVIVNKYDSIKRQNFTIAHEYFEIELYNRLDLSLDEKDKLANELASEFLLPADKINSALKTHNLHKLKEKFPDMSHEVIPRRMCQFLPVVVTVFDNTVLTTRFGSDSINFPKFPDPFEYEVMREVYNIKNTVFQNEPLLDITGYYLAPQNSIVRVYVVTEVDEYI